MTSIYVYTIVSTEYNMYKAQTSRDDHDYYDRYDVCYGPIYVTTVLSNM
jgi:hypothetical protein